MVKLGWLGTLLGVCACSPIGVAPRQTVAPSGARSSASTPAKTATAPAPRPALRPPARPAAEDIAYYRQASQLLVANNLAAAKAIDFARFRRGSMLLSHGGGPTAEGELRPAVESGDLAAIRKAATAILAEDAAHLQAHIILWNLDRDAGHQADADLHDAFIAGMFQSILASGDGRGCGTAFVVYFIREEYDLVRAMGGQSQGQSLHHQGPRSFDILHVKTKSGAERDVYFDITEPFAEEGKLFGLPGAAEE
jgi:hypothetical protein